MSTAGNVQFVKNTNVPPKESVLWKIGDGWKISTKSGKVYTNLEKIKWDRRKPDSEEYFFYHSLTDQLDGKITEPIEHKDLYFVAGASQDGTELVYAFELSEKDKAERQVTFSKQTNVVAAVEELVPDATNQQLSGPPTTTTTTTTATRLPTLIRKQIEVVFNQKPIAWNNWTEIEMALAEGLYPIPVMNTGADNWGFKGENDVKTFWYGKIKLVEITTADAQEQ